MITETGDNIKLNKLLVSLNLAKPKFMNGDRISFKHNPKEIHDRVITIQPVWLREHQEFSKSKNIKVIRKFKYSNNDPWWSGLENEHGANIYVLDESLIHFSIRNMYSPKIITR